MFDDQGHRINSDGTRTDHNMFEQFIDRNEGGPARRLADRERRIKEGNPMPWDPGWRDHFNKR